MKVFDLKDSTRILHHIQIALVILCDALLIVPIKAHFQKSFLSIVPTAQGYPTIFSHCSPLIHGATAMNILFDFPQPCHYHIKQECAGKPMTREIR